MTPQTRTVLMISTGLWYVALVVLVALCSSVAHPVSIISDRFRDSLPVLTQELALPVLGIGPHGHGDFPGPGAYRSPRFYLFWGPLFLGPALILFASISAREPSVGLARWVYGWSLYLAMFAAATVTLFMGVLLLFC